MWPFKKKDKNKVNGKFISDHLINQTNSLIGESRDKLLSFIGDNYHEEKQSESMSAIFIPLKNGCISAATIENDVIFKVNIFLNQEPSEDDLNNCRVFESINSNKYHFFSFLEENTGKYTIGFESKLV